MRRIACFLALGVATLTLAQGARVEQTIAIANKALADQKVVGMSVAVMQDGKVLFAQGFGDADRERSRRAAPDTIYRLGSISKSVTSIAVMKLVEEGKLDLDKDIRTYIPEFPASSKPITARLILAHLSGIRHYRPDRKDNGTMHLSTDEALKLFKADPLLFEPGTQYSYSTHAYTVLAKLVEVASGQSFPQYLRQHVFPEIARSLDVEILSDNKPLRSELYDAAGKLHTVKEDNSWKFAGGGMESNVVDLARFGDQLVRLKLLRPSSMLELWRSNFLPNGEPTMYGLGWALNAEENVVGHSGAQQGARSMLTIDPDKRIVVAVLTNTESARPGPLSLEILDLWRK